MKSSTESQQTDIIQKKTQAFKDRVLTEADPKYKDLFEDFIGWWTQPSKSGKQIRYDGEKYFGMNQRLSTFRKNQKVEVKQQSVKAEVVNTGAYDNVMRNDLKYVYNDDREGNYVKLEHGKGDSVYDFLRSKGVIKDPAIAPKYKQLKEKMAIGFVLARLQDEYKKADPETQEQLKIRGRSVNNGLDADLLPQFKALILTDVFDKYSLDELLKKVQ